MKKNEFIEWTPLDPFTIHARHAEMYDWSTKAEEIYLGLKIEKKEKVDELLRVLLRKTSATEACRVLEEISKALDLPSILQFPSQEKFSGLLGINHVVNNTLDKVFFSSGIPKSSLLGRIFISYGSKAKLGIELELHDELQEKVDQLTPEEKLLLENKILKIQAYNRERKYPLHKMLELGEEIKSILGTTANPIELGLHWIGGIDVHGKDYDFYPDAKDKQDMGFYQFLCIALSSLNFDSLIH
jgi:hypothetical protein